MTINMFDNPIPKPTPEKPRMQPEHFVAKWVDAGFSEKQASQEMFLDICAVVGHPTPVDYGDSQAFTFEKWVPSGVADAYLEGRFGWEFKGGDAQLAGAFNQLLRYQVYLKTPPLLIVSSFNTISPNPPMDRDGRREDSGRGEGVTSAMIRARIRVDGRLAGGLQALLGAPIAGYIGCGERDGGERTRQEALADWAGASLRGRWVGRLMGQWRTGGVRPGVESLAVGRGRG